MTEFICYCFKHTEADIRQDLRDHGGHSQIMEAILNAKKRGGCQCTEKHPESR